MRTGLFQPITTCSVRPSKHWCPITPSNSRLARIGSSMVGGIVVGTVAAAWWKYGATIQKSISRLAAVHVADELLHEPELFVTMEEKFDRAHKEFEKEQKRGDIMIAASLIGSGGTAFLSRFYRNRSPSFCIRSGVSALAIGMYAFYGTGNYYLWKDMTAGTERDWQAQKAEDGRKARADFDMHTFVLPPVEINQMNVTKDAAPLRELELVTVKSSDDLLTVADNVFHAANFTTPEEVLMEMENGSSKSICVWFNYATKKYRVKLFSETVEREGMDQIKVCDVMAYGNFSLLAISTRLAGETHFTKGTLGTKASGAKPTKPECIF